MTIVTGQMCPDEQLTELLQTLGNDDKQALERLDAALALYGSDARLHFLRGSLLAGQRKLDDAHKAMKRAVEIAPDFSVARYQLGFLQFTSGDVEGAEATWRPFLQHPEESPYRHFAAGLLQLSRDEFEPAFQKLEQGIGLNTENLLINNDITTLIAETRLSLTRISTESKPEPITSTQALLQQFGRRSPTQH